MVSSFIVGFRHSFSVFYAETRLDSIQNIWNVFVKRKTVPSLTEDDNKNFPRSIPVNYVLPVTHL
jgi:hypothetical protein